MNGDKVVGPGLIALLGFLRRGFINICGAGVVHIHPPVLQDPSNSQGQGQGVIFFLPSLVGGAGVGPAMSCVQYDKWHAFPSILMKVLIMLYAVALYDMLIYCKVILWHKKGEDFDELPKSMLCLLPSVM